jgi:hypothetical protein
MPKPIPGGSEAGYLGYAVADALIDLLIAKKVISAAEVDSMYRALSQRLAANGEMLGQRSAEFIAGPILGKK